jgi:lipoprotein-anchoring transpeptidase ErfK/SrfK
MKARARAAIAAILLVLAGCNRSDAVRRPAAPKPAKAIPQLPAAASEGRVFLTADQVKQALASGTIDRPIKSLLAVQKPLSFGDYDWNDKAIPDGTTWVRIDLASQLMSVFRDGHEIGTAVIVYGGDNKETPTGKLHILGKAEKHRSSIYDAEMPYTLRLTDDGVSIHGSNVRWGAATHGCIGIPVAFAKHVFEATKVGDEVVIVPANDRTSGQSS